MTALVGGEVQGKVSQVVGLLGLRAKAEKAGGEDLANLGEPLGGGHEVGVEGVVQTRDLREAGTARRISVSGSSTMISAS
jgi:hypothetical protein